MESQMEGVESGVKVFPAYTRSCLKKMQGWSILAIFKIQNYFQKTSSKWSTLIY
jgi:hypothetical protein